MKRRVTYEYYLIRCKIEDRCLDIGRWLIDHPTQSVRKIAKEFNKSKSQVHRDLHYLKYVDDYLYMECMNILKKHRRH